MKEALRWVATIALLGVAVVGAYYGTTRQIQAWDDAATCAAAAREK